MNLYIVKPPFSFVKFNLCKKPPMKRVNILHGGLVSMVFLLLRRGYFPLAFIISQLFGFVNYGGVNFGRLHKMRV